MTRQKVETAALLLAVFVAGGLGGAALERRLADPGTEGERRSSRSLVPPPNEIPRFYRDLGLTDAQREEIEAIMEAARPESDSILREAIPRLRELTRQTREKISAVLTDAQRAQLEESFRRRRSERGDDDGRRRRDGDRRDGREDPPGRDGGNR